jgi:hypothetical protein
MLYYLVPGYLFQAFVTNRECRVPLARFVPDPRGND